MRLHDGGLGTHPTTERNNQPDDSKLNRKLNKLETNGIVLSTCVLNGFWTGWERASKEQEDPILSVVRSHVGWVDPKLVNPPKLIKGGIESHSTVLRTSK
jgi:hypothetical protein